MSKISNQEKDDRYLARYKSQIPTDGDMLREQIKQLKSDLEGATHRIMITNKETSDGYKDAVRWRKKWGFK